MRSKAPLALIEQTIMILIFALAAVLCLRAFAYSESQSAHAAACDRAAIQAENAAEALKHFRGDFARAAGLLGGVWDGATWAIGYDEDWQQTGGQPAYLLTARAEDIAQPYLGGAAIEVATAGGETLFSLPIRWQEVDPHED